MSSPTVNRSTPPPELADRTVIRATNVERVFDTPAGPVVAVGGVSFELPRGAMIALQGPSGCGKSTLLNIIGALDRPSGGTLTVDGIDVGALSGRDEVHYRRSKVGFVFQSFNLIPQLTALENVVLPLELAGHNDGLPRAAHLLRQVGLADAKHQRRPSRLSGGEQQRVAIARALANDPPVLLADEPTANLDAKTGRTIVKLLHKLAREGRTVVIATHDQSIARLADRVIQMWDGRLGTAPADIDEED